MLDPVPIAPPMFADPGDEVGRHNICLCGVLSCRYLSKWVPVFSACLSNCQQPEVATGVISRHLAVFASGKSALTEVPTDYKLFRENNLRAF